MNNQPSILDQLSRQNANAQQDSNSIINNPTATPTAMTPAGDPGISSASITNALGSGTPQTVAAPTGNDNENWFTKLLPTIGNIGGGILGSLTDGFTGPLGTIGGGAAGSALGKALEDALTGKQAGGDILASAGEGALGGGLGVAGGALLKGAGGVLAGAGEKGLAAGEKAAADAAMLENATKTHNAFGAVPTAIKQGINPNQSLQGAQDLARTVGIDHTSPGEMLSTANTALEPLGIFRKDLLMGSGPVNTAGVVDAARNKVAPSMSDIIQSSLHNTHPVTGEQVGSDLTSTLGDPTAIVSGKRLTLPNNASNQFITYAKNLLTPIESKTADPEAVLNASIKVGKDAQAARELAANTSASDVTGLNAAKAEAMTNLDHSVKDMLYNRPEIDSAVAGTNGNFTAAHTGGNQLLADHINNGLTTAQSGQDINKLMSEYMNLKAQGGAGVKVAGDTSSTGAVNGVKQELGMGPDFPVDASGNPVAQIAAALPHPIISAAGKALNVLNPSAGGARSAGAVKLGNLLEKMAPAAGITGGAVVGNSPNMTGGANASTAVGQGGIVSNAVPNAGSIESLLSSNNPQAHMLGQDMLYAAHRMPGQTGTGLGAGDFAEAGNLNKVSTAQNQLATLTNLLNEAGGAQGPIGGFLAKLGAGFTGGAAGTYDSQAEQLVRQLNEVLGTNVAAPSMMTDQGTANNVLRQLQSALTTNGI